MAKSYKSTKFTAIDSQVVVHLRIGAEDYRLNNSALLDVIAAGVKSCVNKNGVGSDGYVLPSYDWTGERRNLLRGACQLVAARGYDVLKAPAVLTQESLNLWTADKAIFTGLAGIPGRAIELEGRKCFKALTVVEQDRLLEILRDSISDCTPVAPVVSADAAAEPEVLEPVLASAFSGKVKAGRNV